MAKVAPIVGRRRELALIDRVLRECAAGRAAVIEVAGEPGIGKTRLVAELASAARARGYAVFATAAELPAPARRSLRAWLEHLASVRPLALIVDDLHRAGDATVAQLGPLLRRPARGPVLVAIAHRPRQSTPRLLAALAQADPEHIVRIELGPLTVAEADELLAGSARRRSHYRDSGGNPSYLLALAQLEASGAGVPRALVAEFAALSPAGTRAACAAAVAGRRFDPELVTAVAAVVESGAGLDELVEHDLVRHAGRGEFRFRHPVLRLAAYHLASPTWRREAHRRAATELRVRGAPPAARAPHVERYAVAGDASAVDELIGAARAEMARAPARAARWLRAALRLVRCDGDAAPRHELLLDLARALGLSGDLVESRAVLHGVLPDLASAARQRRAGAVAFCAMVERLLGHHAEARELLLGELARRRGTPADRAALALELAIGGLMRGDLAEIGRWAAQAAGPEGHGGVRATALGFLSVASYARADVPGAFAHLRAATALVDAMADRELAGHLAAALWLAWNEVYLERYSDAVRHLDRGLRLARATGQAYLLPLMLACRCLALRWLGLLPAAADTAEQAVAAAADTGSGDLRALTLAVQSWIASWTGDRPLALAAGAAAVRAAAGRPGWFSSLAAAMLARSRLVTGDPGGSAATIVAALGGPELAAVDPRSRISWWEVLVRAELAEGDLDAAERHAARAEALAGRIDLPGHEGHARLARAHVLAVRGDPAAAVSAAAAAAAFAKAGLPLEEARACLLAATAPCADPAAGEPRQGEQRQSELRQAKALFDACGARQLAGLAARLQRQRPGADGRVPAPALASLTRREREVAELIADGLSNREIARRLGISDKTVEKHVSRALTKLALSSRSGIAALIARAR